MTRPTPHSAITQTGQKYPVPVIIQITTKEVLITTYATRCDPKSRLACTWRRAACRSLTGSPASEPGSVWVDMPSSIPLGLKVHLLSRAWPESKARFPRALSAEIPPANGTTGPRGHKVIVPGTPAGLIEPKVPECESRCHRTSTRTARSYANDRAKVPTTSGPLALPRRPGPSQTYIR